MIYAGSFIYFHIMILDTNRPSATFSLFKWNGLSETSLVGCFFLLPLIWHLYLQNITLFMLKYMSISFKILFLIRMINARSFIFFHHKKIDFEKKRSRTTCVFFKIYINWILLCRIIPTSNILLIFTTWYMYKLTIFDNGLFYINF